MTQWKLSLTKATFIKKAEKDNVLDLTNCFALTSLWELDKYKNSDMTDLIKNTSLLLFVVFQYYINQNTLTFDIDVLCAIIHGFLEAIIFTSRDPRTIRKFVVVNPK